MCRYEFQSMDNIYPLSSLYWQKGHSPNMSAFYAPYFANHSQAFAFLNKSRDETPACLLRTDAPIKSDDPAQSARSAGAPTTVTISNVVPRRDVTGAIVNAHAGGICQMVMLSRFACCPSR